MKPSFRPPPRATLAALGPVPAACQRLLHQLRRTPWLCQGTVVCRPLIRRIRGRNVKKGPYYLWTCKVKGQTHCVALSKAQHQLLSQAIENNRRVQKSLTQLQAFTLKTILQNLPGVKKRR